MSKRTNAPNAVAFGSCTQFAAKASMPRTDRQPCFNCGPYRVDQDPYVRYWRTITEVVVNAARR